MRYATVMQPEVRHLPEAAERVARDDRKRYVRDPEVRHAEHALKGVDLYRQSRVGRTRDSELFRFDQLRERQRSENEARVSRNDDTEQADVLAVLEGVGRDLVDESIVEQQLAQMGERAEALARQSADAAAREHEHAQTRHAAEGERVDERHDTVDDDDVRQVSVAESVRRDDVNAALRDVHEAAGGEFRFRRRRGDDGVRRQRAGRARQRHARRVPRHFRRRRVVDAAEGERLHVTQVAVGELDPMHVLQSLEGEAAEDGDTCSRHDNGADVLGVREDAWFQRERRHVADFDAWHVTHAVKGIRLDGEVVTSAAEQHRQAPDPRERVPLHRRDVVVAQIDDAVPARCGCGCACALVTGDPT